jgi:hypothetical protein
MDLSKIADRVPYLNGGFRLRFIAGLVFLSVVLLLTLGSGLLEIDSLKRVLSFSAPILFISLALLIYATGCLVEVLADTIVIRAVMGAHVGYTVGVRLLAQARGWGLVGRTWTGIPRAVWRTLLTLAAAVSLFFQVLINAVAGLSVRLPSVRLEESVLETSAWKAAPPEVREILLSPFGQGSELVSWYLPSLFRSARDQAWARSLLNSARETLLVSSALVIPIVAIILLTIPGMISFGRARMADSGALRNLQIELADIVSARVWPDTQRFEDDLVSIRKQRESTLSAWKPFPLGSRLDNSLGAEKVFRFAKLKLSDITQSDVDDLAFALASPWPSGISDVYPDRRLLEGRILWRLVAAHDAAPEFSGGPGSILVVLFMLLGVAMELVIFSLLMLGAGRKYESVLVTLLQAASVRQINDRASASP